MPGFVYGVSEISLFINVLRREARVVVRLFSNLQWPDPAGVPFVRIEARAFANHLRSFLAHPVGQNLFLIMARQKRPPAIVRPAATLRPVTRLRPSVAGPDAIPLGCMVSKYTSADLNKEGYINNPTGSTINELESAFGYGAIIRRAEELKGHHQIGEPFHIHPCLQRSRWNKMNDDEDWEAILPSVELASRFLDDPSITPFFAGLAGDNIRKLDDPILEKTHNMDFVQWDLDKTVGQENDAATENALFAMMAFRNWIKLRF